MENTNAIKALVIVPSDYPKDRDIAKSISELVRKYGGFCCHTSSPTMKFDSIEERHQERIRAALKNGTKVYAFSASSELVQMGIIQMGNMRFKVTERLEAAISAN